MEVVNELYTYANSIKKEEYNTPFIKETLETLIKLIAPFAPCFAEEVWQLIGNKKSVFLGKWPTYDERILRGAKISLPIQINGKLRKVLEVDREVPEEKLFQLALADEQIRKYTDGKKIIKKIYVKEKLINLVIAS
jgi:leucyl-tRNA synthetase